MLWMAVVVPVTIGSNINALSAVRGLDRATGNLSSVYERLASGQRINRASDDAAGLAVASTLNAKSRIYTQAVRNVNDGLSLIAIAEGALGSLRDIVTRVSELSEQAASGSYSPKQRVELDREADSLLKEYNRIIQSTSFNGNRILDGSQASVFLQHGIGTEQMTGVAVGREIGVQAGDATFLARTVQGASNSPIRVESSDVNGDGLSDLIVANSHQVIETGISSGGSVSVYLSNGNGTFRAPRSYQTDVNPISVYIQDLNQDGKEDLILGGSTASVLMGNGDGTFLARRSVAVEGTVVVADFNSDGHYDIGATSLTTGILGIALGNSDGTFRKPLQTQVGLSYNPAVGDFNGDGIVDLAMTFLGNGVGIFTGNGDGTFGAVSTLYTGSSPRRLVVGDFNGDDALDLVVAESVDNQLSFFAGNGDGSFKARALVGAITNAWSVVSGDFNGDGKLDLAGTGYFANTVHTFMGQGDGTFRTSVSMSTSTQPFAGVVDANNDGIDDLVTADAGSNTLSLFLGNADSSGRRNNLVEMLDLTSIIINGSVT